jgi:hypothetical protein
MAKKTGKDYVVMPLEGLWWADDMSVFNTEFFEKNKDDWRWTSMIMQPEFITQEMVEEAIEKVKEKDPPALAKVRFDVFTEGLSAQIMYFGPYSEEGPTIKRMHDFIEEKGYDLQGKHHEIYLSDPRRTKPEKLKTIIRQPIKPS